MSSPIETARHAAGRAMHPRVRLAVVAMLTFHAVLLGLALARNAPTIDEVVHLPTGISYWHKGEFWCYHHNPPLVRLLFALPAVLIDVPTDYRNYEYVPGSRAPDCTLGRDFMLLNQKNYVRIYAISRSVVAALSVLGGWLVFRWSRELYGDPGGLLSLALWVICPNILAHGGLVTPDLGSTVIAFFATYQFWHYLRAPSLRRAISSGILLGLAEASKFSFVVLPMAWGAVAGVKLWSGDRGGAGVRLTPARAAGHALLLSFMALLTLNDVYLGEGTGKPLGAFQFRSGLLTDGQNLKTQGPDVFARRGNRFRNTMLAGLPVPLPEHYLLGFDDQAFDVDSLSYYKYLRGERRHAEPGWYHYYLYCFLVKTPLGTLALLATAIVAATRRRCRAGPLDEAALLLPPLAILVLVSSQTGLNSHLRYILPIYPFVFVAAGRIGPLLGATLRWRAWAAACLAASALSVLNVHPHYLTYFNEPAGGPDRGLEHLADSNIDWGQGLLALRDWLDGHAPGRPIRLAYFGTMFPEVLGLRYELPPFGPAGDASRVGSTSPGPAPGLQAVSANYLLGIPFPAPDASGRQVDVPEDAYTYYRRFEPVAIVGHSIFVYDITREQADRVRATLGLPPWREADPVADEPAAR